MRHTGKFHPSSPSSNPPTAKSCEDNIGEDPIKSEVLQYEVLPPRPKSYMAASDDSEWDYFTSSQKKERNQMIFPQEQEEILKPEKKPVYRRQNRNDRNFADEIVESESIEESVFSSSSQQQVLMNGNSVRNEIGRAACLPKERQFFNLVLVGAACTGKTTYMECFLRQYKHKNQQVIKEHTQKITQAKSPPLSFNLSLDFSIIDTPGYTHSSIDSYCRLIQDQIRNRMEKTKRNRKNYAQQVSNQGKQGKERADSQPKDERIHCCLFFFRGPRLHTDDWRLLEELHDKCNIIPIIAKGDCYTIEQISELKKSIVTKAGEKRIKWFDIQQFLRQKYPEELQSITKGPYGISPPFMIACSTTKIERQKDIRIGRQYKWGTCYADDEKHTEFSTLNRLLIRCLHKGLVTKLDVMEDVQKAKIDNKNQMKKLSGFIGLGLTMVMLAIIAKKIGHQQALKN